AVRHRPARSLRPCTSTLIVALEATAPPSCRWVRSSAQALGELLVGLLERVGGGLEELAETLESVDQTLRVAVPLGVALLEPVLCRPGEHRGEALEAASQGAELRTSIVGLGHH